MKPPPVLPQRPKSHVIGDQAVDIFIAACDPSWVISPVQKDYGLDLRIEVARDGYVTGEEFFVQIKGHSSVNGTALPTAKVKQSTINYWLRKLAPTMVAVVDTTAQTVFYDWLEFCYQPYPDACQTQSIIDLPLRHSSDAHDIKKEVYAYLRRYYASISKDMERLSKGIFLSNLLFSISSLHRLSTRTAIDFQRDEPTEPEELKQFLQRFCFAFACHDGILEGLRTGAYGHRPPVNSRFFKVVEHKLFSYDEIRNKFLVYRSETADGDHLIFEPRYAEIVAWLLPMIDILDDMEETLGLAQVLNRLPVNRA